MSQLAYWNRLYQIKTIMNTISQISLNLVRKKHEQRNKEITTVDIALLRLLAFKN